MKFARLARHLATTRKTIRARFSADELALIQQAIIASERLHRGRVCLAVETALQPSQLWRDMSARERALELFARLHVWDTVENSGVLIYVLFADRAIEIIADRGVCPSAGQNAWLDIAETMRAHFSAGSYTQGMLAGVAEVSRELARLLPASPMNADASPGAADVRADRSGWAGFPDSWPPIENRQAAIHGQPPA